MSPLHGFPPAFSGKEQNLREQIEDLEKTVAFLKRERNECRAGIREMQERIERQDEHMASLRRENELIQMTMEIYREMTKLMAENQARLDSPPGPLFVPTTPDTHFPPETVANPAPELRDDLNRTHQDVNDLTAAVEDLHARLLNAITGQKEINKETEARLDDMASQMLNNTRRLDSQMLNNTRRLDSHWIKFSQAIEDLSEKLTTLAEGLSSQTELQGMTNRTTDDRIGGLAQGIDRVVNTIDGLTRAIEGLDNRIITLERKDRDG
jgi:chromosome segregation ATPase